MKEATYHTGKPGDLNYLLRGLDHTICRFKVAQHVRRIDSVSTDSTLEQEALSFVEGKPGATIKQIQSASPSLQALNHIEARALVVSLIDKGLLQVVGETPLEEIDGRYERVPSCNLCHDPSDRHPIAFWKYNTPVVRCTICGLMYSNPRWKAEHLFGRYTPEYWQQYADKVKSTAVDPVSNQARWDPYLNTLENARLTGKLLDVGCATGEFLMAAKARGWEVYGVEPSSQAVQLAQQATGGVIHSGTLDTALFAEGQFDAVTMWDVIEHVQNPRAYIEQAARLVRHGGMLSLTTPNIRSTTYRLLGPKWWVVGPNDHIYYFSPRTLQRLLLSCGFNIHVMGTEGNTLDTWQQYIRLSVLRPVALALCRLAQPLTLRFLWGDELYVAARRV